MNKTRAIVCTALLVFTLVTVLTASFFVVNEYGVSLYQIIVGALGYLWIGDHIESFYKYMMK